MFALYTIEADSEQLFSLLGKISRGMSSTKDFDTRENCLKHADGRPLSFKFKDMEYFRLALIAQKKIPAYTLGRIKLDIDRRRNKARESLSCYMDKASIPIQEWVWREMWYNYLNVSRTLYHILSSDYMLIENGVKKTYLIPDFLYNKLQEPDIKEEWLKNDFTKDIKFKKLVVNDEIPTLLTLSAKKVKEGCQNIEINNRKEFLTEEMPEGLYRKCFHIQKYQTDGFIGIKDVFAGGLFDEKNRGTLFTPQYPGINRYIASSTELQDLLENPFNRKMINLMNFHEQIEYMDYELKGNDGVAAAAKLNAFITNNRVLTSAFPPLPTGEYVTPEMFAYSVEDIPEIYANNVEAINEPDNAESIEEISQTYLTYSIAIPTKIEKAFACNSPSFWCPVF